MLVCQCVCVGVLVCQCVDTKKIINVIFMNS